MILKKILNTSPILFFQEFRYWKSFSLWCCQQNLHCNRQFPCGYAVLWTLLWHDWCCNRCVLYIWVSYIHTCSCNLSGGKQLAVWKGSNFWGFWQGPSGMGSLALIQVLQVAEWFLFRFAVGSSRRAVLESRLRLAFSRHCLGFCPVPSRYWDLTRSKKRLFKVISITKWVLVPDLTWGLVKWKILTLSESKESE